MLTQTLSQYKRIFNFFWSGSEKFPYTLAGKTFFSFIFKKYFFIRERRGRGPLARSSHNSERGGEGGRKGNIQTADLPNGVYPSFLVWVDIHFRPFGSWPQASFLLLSLSLSPLPPLKGQRRKRRRRKRPRRRRRCWNHQKKWLLHLLSPYFIIYVIHLSSVMSVSII